MDKMKNPWFIFWYGIDSYGDVVLLDECSYSSFSSALADACFAYPIEICFYDGKSYVRKASSSSFWEL